MGNNSLTAKNEWKLMAYIPGAAKESMDANVEKGILAINAPVLQSIVWRPICTEVDMAYYRQFSIPDYWVTRRQRPN